MQCPYHARLAAELAAHMRVRGVPVVGSRARWLTKWHAPPRGVGEVTRVACAWKPHLNRASDSQSLVPVGTRPPPAPRFDPRALDPDNAPVSRTNRQGIRVTMRVPSWATVLLAPWLLSCGLPDLPTTPPQPDATQPRDLFEPPDNFVPGDADAPGFAVISVTPARGPVSGGTRVEVTGVGFLPGSRVVFGASLGDEVVVLNDTVIQVTTPPHPAGLVTVHVVRPDGKVASLADAFFYETPVVVRSVTPALGPTTGGTPVVVEGDGFFDDTTLVIGGRVAAEAHVLSPSSLVALTPPGSVGPRDVMALNAMGSATARRAFHYVAPPTLTSCDPALLPVGATSEVLIRGTGLDLAQSVHAPGAASALLESHATAVKVSIGPTGPGPLDVTVTTPGGSATAASCAWALDAADLQATTPRIFGISPPYGPTAGGYERRVFVSGVGTVPADQVEVSLGGSIAPVVQMSPDRHVLTVRVPAHPPGVVDGALTTPTGSDVAPGAFEYVPEVILAGVTPASGPASGGTEVVVSGSSLDRVTVLFVGPLPATLLAAPAPGEVRARTAPANPGLHDVRALTSWGEVVTLPKAFTFGGDEPGLTVVTPDRGSIAGGTVVAVVGSALDRAAMVTFAGTEAAVLDASDPARLVVRTPPGSPGPADVAVTWPDGTVLARPGAFTYFDPTGYFGGVWGDVVQGAVNVTVLDSMNGKPVPLAFAILGADAATPYQGTTDLRGQVTLSGEDLFGPIQVTASRQDYSTVTIAGVDAENVTLFLDPVVPTSSGGGTSAQPLPPGTVEGVVLGADKYLLAPPESCADRPLIHGDLCRPCVQDADCGSGYCVNPSGSGHFCASSCVGSPDCPTGYACYPLGAGLNGCLPAPGVPEVRCGTSVRGLNSFPIDPGPGAVMGEGGRYALNAGLGDIAVYCVGGFRTEPDGAFRPLALGVRRHVEVYPAQVVSGQDIRLDIPLDRTLLVRLISPPGGPTGPYIHRVRLALNLGSDGYLPLWTDQEATDGERFEFQGVPRDLTGSLEGATFEVQGEADSPTDGDIPYSVSMERDFTPGRDLGAVRIRLGEPDGAGTGDVAQRVETTARPDAFGGCAAPNGGGVVVTGQGRIWRVGPDLAMLPWPSPSYQALRGCTFLPDGRVLVVGNGGMVARVDAALADVEPVPSVARLYAAAVGPDGTEYVAGHGVLLRRRPLSTWEALDIGTLAPLFAVTATPSLGDGVEAVAVGAAGTMVVVRGSGPEQVRPAPTNRDLFAIATLDATLLVVGARGTVLVGIPGSAFQAIPPATDADLQAILAFPGGEALVAGALGTLLHLRDHTLAPIPTPDLRGEFTVVLSGSEPPEAFAFSRDAIAVGPFLPIPDFSSPPPGGLWTNLRLAWTLPAPPVPSLTYTRLLGTKSSRDWAILAPGSLTDITLPDLTLAAGLVPLPTGDLRLYALHMLMDHFDINAFDTNSFSMSTWRSYAVQQFVFRRP